MKKTVIIICICLIVIWFLQCKNDDIRKDPRGNDFAGSQACSKCHANIYNSYLHTAHYLASLPATKQNVHGNFSEYSNIFKLNDSQKIVMEKLDSGLFQTYYLHEKVKERYRFDIVFGGVKGESYLYWSGNEFFQLPISYFTQQHQWSTSPGYGFNFLEYPTSRQIKKQCMECHASYISDLPETYQGFNKKEEFDKSSLVLSIDCERCHGPAARHVEFHTQHPEIKTARFITAYASLNRSQKIDMCAICHSGKPVDKLRSTFEFVPGDSFAKFKIPELYSSVDTTNLDVHGNQLQLLQSSKCYMYSNMTCTTCHDVHQNTRGESVLYVQKCLGCHNTTHTIYCKLTNQLSDAALKANCINCHMPALTSRKITVQVANTLPSIKFFVHTHYITTYPEEVKKILAYVNK